MNSNQMLAVWGSPGSGATTIAIKIAQKLEILKRSALVVFCDNETPNLPIIYSGKNQETRSLGTLLAQTRITQNDVLRQMVPISNNISILGYQSEENEKTYPAYSEGSAHDFLSTMSDLADHIILDCSHHISSNVLSRVSLESADVTLRIVNATAKSAMYLKSQRRLLSNSPCSYDKQTIVLNNLEHGQDECAYLEAIGDPRYSLPHTPMLTNQFETGKLLDPLFGREGKLFEASIRDIIKDVFIY